MYYIFSGTNSPLRKIRFPHSKWEQRSYEFSPLLSSPPLPSPPLPSPPLPSPPLPSPPLPSPPLPQQRQQKRVAEENTFYFDVLQKALPQEEGKLTEEGHREKTDDSAHSSDQKGEQKAKISPKPPAGTKNMHKTQSTSGSRHTRGGSVNRSQDQKVSMNAKPPLTPHDTPKENGVHAAGVTPEPVANGDIVRPSSAGKIHTASGRRQAAVVRAVPRSDPPSPSVPPHLPMAEAEDKVGSPLVDLMIFVDGDMRYLMVHGTALLVEWNPSYRTPLI